MNNYDYLIEKKVTLIQNGMMKLLYAHLILIRNHLKMLELMMEKTIAYHYLIDLESYSNIQMERALKFLNDLKKLILWVLKLIVVEIN